MVLKIFLDSEHSVALAACRAHFLAMIAFKISGKPGIGPLHLKGSFSVHNILSGNKQAESRLEVMILGDLVIIAVAFRTAAGQPRAQKRQKLRELLWDSNHHFPQDMLTTNVYFYDAKRKKLRKA